MRIFILLILMNGLLFAQNTDRKYMVIEAKTLEKCDPKSKEYDKNIVTELLTLGTPYGTGLYINGNRVSNDSVLIIVEYHSCVEKVTKQEQDDAKLTVSVESDYQSSKEKDKYEKQKAHDTKCTDKKTAKYISDAFRWYKYFKDDEDIHEYLNKNSKDWDLDEIVTKETGVKNAIY